MKYEYVDLMHVFNRICQGMLFIWSCYFLYSESKQLKKEGINYLASPWNYLDFVPSILMIAFIIFELLGEFDGKEKRLHLQGIMQATMTLLIWLKALYFLRIF